ncbi:DUF2971 domain-containing protein [Aeromonas veronii]|uniref:DUF2971 domain-containing protein n=1 Tax=Aeromonas veronii TaxID=654 RepID=UPI003D1FD0BD
MMNVFKYLGRAASEFFLSDMTLRFSQPKALNDPFELRPEFYCEPFDLKGRTQFKTRFVLKGHSSVVKNYIVKQDNFSAKSLAVDTRYQVEQLNSLLGVLCLTRDSRSTPKNLLMWAHYSESHSGIVVKFKSDCEFVSNAHEVHYVKSRPLISAKIFYDHECISIGDMYFKSDAWSYEKEIRASVRLEDCINTGHKDVFGYDIYVSAIDVSAIECVYIGVNASKELKTRASEFHKKTGVDVIYLTVSSEGFILIPYRFDTQKTYDSMMASVFAFHEKVPELAPPV